MKDRILVCRMCISINPQPKDQTKGGEMKIQLESGSSSDGRVWIGAPAECYDEVKKEFSGKRLHLLCFTPKQAQAVIEMLQLEIELANAQPQGE